MATRTLIGEPVITPDGHSYSVYTEHWANEAPDCLAIDGHACLVFCDPGSKQGRDAVLTLIKNLAGALDAHDRAVEDIYAHLTPGDDAARIRVAHESEPRCRALRNGDRCVRVDHADGHHVTTVDTVATGYAVAAVWHETHPAPPHPSLYVREA